MKVCRWTVHQKFHKMCELESRVTSIDVIMIPLPKNNGKQLENANLSRTKQNIYPWKGFIEFEPLCQKLWAFM